MNCPAWQDLLQQHLDGDAGPAALDHHLRDCPACAAHQADVRRLLAGLTLLRPPVPPAHLAGRLTDCLCAEFRTRQARTWRRRLGALAGLAAAAAVLLALGLRSGWPIAGQPRDDVAVRPDPLPAEPPVGNPMAQAGQAVAALTSRTASDTVDRTTTLFPLVGRPSLDPLPVEPVDDEPRLEPLRESAHAVSAGLAPVTDSARRAVNLFFRDLPVGRGSASGTDNNPG
jgi:hypothetical protein